jgi:hypothetical protein
MQFQGRFERSGFCYNFNSRLRVRCVAFVNEISILTTKAFTAGIPIGARRERRNPKHSAAAISQSNGMEVRRREVATIFTDITSFTSLGGCQQVSRHAYLRQRRGRWRRKGVSSQAGRRSDVARAQRAAAGLRTTGGGCIQRTGDDAVF